MPNKNSLSIQSTTARADFIDEHVGRRLRLRRNVLGLSQGELARSIGLTFQQVQKYERGINRISASKLFYASKALKVPVSFFFEDIHADEYTVPDADIQALEDTSQSQYEDDPMQREETLKLVCAYYRVQDGNMRQKFLQLIEGYSTVGSVKKIQESEYVK
jgi:transcriptional regulator with XRE-family HTH domain